MKKIHSITAYMNCRNFLYFCQSHFQSKHLSVSYPLFVIQWAGHCSFKDLVLIVLKDLSTLCRFEIPTDDEEEEERAKRELTPIPEDDDDEPELKDSDVDVEVHEEEPHKEPSKEQEEEQEEDNKKEEAKVEAMDTSQEVEESLEEGEVPDTEEEAQGTQPAVNKGLEEDVAMALLQMHDSKGPPSPPKQLTPKKPEKEETGPPEYSAILEHNYFMKGTPKKERRQRRDSGIFEEIPGVVLNGPDDVAIIPPTKESDETDSASEGEPELTPCLPTMLAVDHQYCQLYHPVEQQPSRSGHRKTDRILITNENQAPAMDIGAETEVVASAQPVKKGRKRKISDVTNLGGSRELASLLPPPKPKPKFKPRILKEEIDIAYDFLIKGIDLEDLEYLRQRYEELLSDDRPQTFWLNDTHWVDHCPTYVPDPPKKRTKDPELAKHKTGGARTEGYYKISYADKHLYLGNSRGVHAYQDIDQKQISLVSQDHIVISIMKYLTEKY